MDDFLMKTPLEKNGRIRGGSQCQEMAVVKERREEWRLYKKHLRQRQSSKKILARPIGHTWAKADGQKVLRISPQQCSAGSSLKDVGPQPWPPWWTQGTAAWPLISYVPRSLSSEEHVFMAAIMQTMWLKLKDMCSVKKSQTQRVHNVGFHFCDVPCQAKVIFTHI